MKKIYLLISSITLGSLAFGQVEKVSNNEVKTLNVVKHHLSSEKSIVKSSQSKEKAAGDIKYSTDFSQGLNAVGGYGAWTTSGTNGSVWKKSSKGPIGDYSDYSQIITSTTAANGFLIFDADSTNKAKGGTPADLSGNLHSPIIDLTGVDAAILSFEQSYRHCCSNTFFPAIEVTTDNFVTKKQYDVTTPGVGVNGSTPVSVINVNLSSYLKTATNKNQFQFRFVWAANEEYFWQVDDISIYENQPVEVELSSLMLSRYFAANDMIYTAGKERTSIPKEFADSLDVQGIVKNNGANDISTATKLKVTLFDANKNAIADSTGGTLFQTPSTKGIADTITFVNCIDLSKLAIGTYTVECVLETPGDTEQNNDTIIRTIKITEGLLGQENYDDLTYRTYSGGYNAAPADDDYQTVGNIFYIPVPEDPSVTEFDLQGLEITLRQSSSYPITANTEVEVKVFKIDPSATTSDARYIDQQESRIFKIAPSDIPALSTTTAGTNNKNLMLNLNKNGGPIKLTAGEIYLIGFYHNGGNILNVQQRIAFATQTADPDYSSILNTKATDTGQPTWYWLGRQFLGRLSFDKSLSIEENESEISNSNLFPNPTTGKSTVSYSLGTASKVSVKVVDVTGKVVYTSTEESKEAGNHTSTIDATAFNTGVYYVTVSTNESQLTQKLIKK